MREKSILGLAGGPEDGASEEAQAMALGTAPNDENMFETVYADSYYEDVPKPVGRWKSFIIPTLLGFAFLGWTGFFAWTYQTEFLAVPANARIVELIVTWSIPTLLLGVCWLLALRHSSAEATRFGNVARLLHDESVALEQRMHGVNAEITLAREFLAQNARELESVGRQSAKKLVEAAEQIGSALADSDERAKTLEAVSNTATGNLDLLRKHLPVVISAAKDATNQIGAAGNSAQQHVADMTASLDQLSSAAESAAQSAGAMAQSVAESGERLGETLKVGTQRLMSVTTSAEERTSVMTGSLYDAADMAASRLTEMSTAIEQQTRQSGEALTAQIATLESAIESLSEQSASEDARISATIERISEHIETSAARISEVDASATDGAAKLAFAVSALSDSSARLGGSLGDNKDKAEELIKRTEQLLTALESANREIDEALPAAMERTDQRFANTLAHIDTMKAGADALDQHSDDLLAKITSIEHLISVQQDSVAKLMSESDVHFAIRHEQADALASALTSTRDLIGQMNDTANEELVASLLRVRETTRQAAESSRKILDEELSTVAERLSEQNRNLLAGAVDGQIAAMGEMMQQSIDRHIGLSENATQRMTAQLAELDEMTHNLEQRVAETKTGFDGINDDSFARRMALLTESLNSTAIDVAKILSNDVTDTAWAAYLKGDRGVFTRRAVRLLDAGEVKAIVAHYDEDAEFREHVNRYIHDFESMMRVLLSTRDGNAIGVTLLSSDVGKLYVALAQAIERLRS